MEVRKIKAEKISAAEYNPRKDLKPDDTEYKKIERSIEMFGYIEPIIWNETTGNIVGGHQRYKILKDKGVEEIECVVVRLSEREEKILNVSLNKITGIWDIGKLQDLLRELSEIDKTDLTGFDESEIEELLAEFNHIDDLLEESFSDYSEKPQKENYTMTFSLPAEVREIVEEYLENTDNAKTELAVAVMDRVKGLI